MKSFVEKLIQAMPANPIEANRVRRVFRIDDIWHDGPRYIGLRVRVDKKYADSYRIAGQYTTLQFGAILPRFFVIANAPGHPLDDGWEFLIEPDQELAEVLADMKPGATVSISPAEGPGFAPTALKGRDVLMFATGSGIATMRPVIQYALLNPRQTPASIALYYGENHYSDFAYQDEIAQWVIQGIRVRKTVGMPEQGMANHHQYVQQAFEADAPDLSNTIALLSGAPIMLRKTSEALLTRGLPQKNILLNL